MKSLFRLRRVAICVGVDGGQAEDDVVGVRFIPRMPDTDLIGSGISSLLGL